MLQPLRGWGAVRGGKGQYQAALGWDGGAKHLSLEQCGGVEGLVVNSKVFGAHGRCE